MSSPDDKHWIRLDAKLDRLDEKLDDVRITQTHQAGVLDEHIRRTELAETSVDLMSRRVAVLERSSVYWAWVGKAIAGLAALGTAAAGLISALRGG